MQIQCDSSDLIASASIVGRALSTRTTMPILEGIYMDAREQTVRMVCTDLQKGIETILPARVLGEGAVVLPGHIFLEIVRKLPTGQVEMRATEKEVTIDCNDSHTTLQTMDPSDFPQLPDVVDSNCVRMDQGALKNMISQTLFAAATDESRLILTGVLFEIDANLCRMVALDGYRLALRQADLGEDYGKLSAVVPAASFGEIARILDGSAQEKAHIALTGSHMLIRIGDTRFVTRLLEGDFIRYRQILPADWQTRVLADVSLMAQAVDRASTLARDGRNNLIRFSVSSNTLEIRSNSELGNIQESVPMQLEGKEIEIAFNARYLSDVFKNLEAEEIYLCFTTNVSPCVMQPVQGDDFLYLVLPVRVYTQ